MTSTESSLLSILYPPAIMTHGLFTGNKKIVLIIMPKKQIVKQIELTESLHRWELKTINNRPPSCASITRNNQAFVIKLL